MQNSLMILKIYFFVSVQLIIPNLTYTCNINIYNINVYEFELIINLKKSCVQFVHFSTGKCSCKEKRLKSMSDLCKMKHAYGKPVFLVMHFKFILCIDSLDK